MDNIFGCEVTTCDTEKWIVKSYGPKMETILSCHFLGCKVKTVKLKRHLQLKHGKEPNSTIDYAMHAARTMEKNKYTSAKVPDVPKVEAVAK